MNAGIGGMGEPWAGGSGSSQIPTKVSRRAADVAAQLADPVDRSICHPSAQIPIRSEDFPLGPKECLPTITVAVQSRFSPRIGRRRALRGPWSVSSGLFAWASVRWKAAGSSSSRTRG